MTNIIKCVVFMIFMHIVDDYYLQGILASMKQKSWWQKQESYCDKYKNDYKVALFMHSFSWAFMIMLPILYVFKLSYGMALPIIFLIVNTGIHCIVDDLKANKHKINLIVDQSIHIVQIIITTVVTWVVIQ